MRSGQALCILSTSQKKIVKSNLIFRIHWLITNYDTYLSPLSVYIKFLLSTPSTLNQISKCSQNKFLLIYEINCFVLPLRWPISSAEERCSDFGPSLFWLYRTFSVWSNFAESFQIVYGNDNTITFYSDCFIFQTMFDKMNRLEVLLIVLCWWSCIMLYVSVWNNLFPCL